MKGEQCFHCGEPLPTKPNLFDNKSFCCNGCVQVYKLLSESGLDGVYENEGFLPTANQKLEDYSYLDQAEIQKALIRYEKEGVKVVSFELPNIHCASCLFVLEAMPSWQDGIKRVDVQFSSRRAIIYFDPNSLKLSEVASRLHQIGYPIHLNLDNTEKAPDGSRRYIAPMAVAGFCFGNIMMFSLPEYLGLDNLDHGEYGHLFRYLSMLLTFPVMFYAANVWHKSAFEALKRKAITIDLPIVAGIWVLFLRSIYEVVALHQPGFFDSLAGLVFFLLIGKWYQQKTFDRLSFDKSFTAFLPLAVKVFDKDENIVSKSAAGIEKGDELFIRHGEIIPVDGELISETADINYSFITGESLPEQIKSGDQIFAGGSVHGKAIRVKALRKVEESYLHALWDSQKSGVKSTFQNMTDSISANFSAAILIIAAVGALIWLPFDASKSAMVFTAVLIVACPCALALAAPFSMGSGIRSLAKRGVFIKNPDAMERMGTIDTLIFDKTGTLSFHDREKIQWLGDVLSGEEKTLIASTAHQSGHPSSHAIAHYLNANLLDPDDFEETTGKGVTARFGQQQIQLGSADFVGAESREKARVFVAIDGEVRGFFSWKSQYRSGIDEMLHKLSKSYPIALLSGDTDTERPALLKLFEGWKDLWFKQKPDEKMNIVENWQLEGKRVLMAGDGLNDSAALQTAWFGLAVSENTQAFGPSSDGIIQADALPHLPEILQYAKKLQQVTRESLRISLIYNVLGLSFALAGVLTPIYCAILMPLSSVSVVAYVVLRERAVHAVIMGQRKKIPQKPATAFAASS